MIMRQGVTSDLVNSNGFATFVIYVKVKKTAVNFLLLWTDLKSHHSTLHRPLCYLLTVSHSGLLFSSATAKPLSPLAMQSVGTQQPQ